MPNGDGMSRSSISITARHLANCAPSCRYSASRSCKPSSPSVTLLPGCSGLGALVDLDARDDSPARQQRGEWDVIARALAQAFVEQDDAAESACYAVGGKQDFAVAPAVFFGGLELDRIEAFLDGGVAFVCCQHAFRFRDDCIGHGLEFVDVQWAGTLR
jgi:hypothetical protein